MYIYIHTYIHLVSKLSSFVMSYELLACILNCLWFVMGVNGRLNYERVYIVEVQRHGSPRCYPGGDPLYVVVAFPIRAQVP